MPPVSVVLPFFNAPFLSEAIQSILDQSYIDFELILVDNGSTDDSKNIAQSFMTDSRVSLISVPKRGVMYAANAGIRQAIGKYIARMDADDIAHGDRLKKQTEKLSSDSELGLVSGLVEYLGAKENQGFIHYVNWLNTIQSAEEIRLNQFVEFPLANPTIMFRRELFSKYGMYEDGDFPEDYEYFLRLQYHGVKMEKIAEPLLQWRDSPSRLTRTDNRYSQEAFFKVKARYLARWLERNNPFHPNVYLWGNGRLSRRRSGYLLNEGINVVDYIDVKEADHTLHYTAITKPSDFFIVSYVSNRGARDEIRSFLRDRSFEEGRHFIIAS